MNPGPSLVAAIEFVVLASAAVGSLVGGVMWMLRVFSKRLDRLKEDLLASFTAKITDIETDLSHHATNHRQMSEGTSVKLAEHDRAIVRLDNEVSHLRQADIELAKKLDDGFRDMKQEARDRDEKNRQIAETNQKHMEGKLDGMVESLRELRSVSLKT